MKLKNEVYNRKQLIKYFRNSIADAERNEMDQSKLDEGYIISLRDIQKGKISADLVNVLFRRPPKESSAEIKEKECTIDVLLCPLQFNINSIHEQGITSLPSVIVPFIIPAKLTYLGELKIQEGKTPWIPRRYLAPSHDITIGELKSADDFLSKFKLPIIDSKWEIYWRYCNQMFHQVTGFNIREAELQYYTLSNKSYLLIDDQIKGTRQHISKLYDFLLTDNEAQINKLLSNYTSLNKAPKLKLIDDIELLDASVHHYGQVGNEFPLSTSQRESLHHFRLCEEGDILAVNGPPGTGKTTLLHSVIAQGIVEAAARGAENPPIIVATSNNNQAVTNIIDSLGKVCESEHPLAKRWLPDIKSYGMYIASETKIKNLKDKEKYHTLTSNNTGLPQLMENKEYVQHAINSFIKHYAQAFQIPLEQVRFQKCSAVIHKKLQEKLHNIKETIEIVKQYDTIRNYVNKQYGSPDQLDIYIHTLKDEITDVKNGISGIALLDEGFMKFRKTLRWYIKKLEFIPYFRKKSEFENEMFLRKSGVNLELFKFDTLSVRESMLTNIRQLSSILKQKEQKFMRAQMDKGVLEDKTALVLECNRRLGIKTDKQTLWYEQVLEALDTTERFEAFHLAVHYYEAKWIEEVSKDLAEGYVDKKSVPKQMRKWRRYAKVTPCFVSTFFMAPVFFKAWPGRDEYLFNFIDVLIVDEAGQVPPEVAGATLSLAKKAIVVGDTLQIEPVWGITETIDRANMKEILPTIKMDAEDFIDYGMAASSGNVMRIAQQLCKYDKFQGTGGMYLTEHRRCIPEIIQYCNQLAYEGRLEAKRQNTLNKERRFPLPYMGHVHVTGQAERVNTSWKNEVEAQKITEWIINNKEQIREYYEKSGKVFHLKEYIAVVTPFSVQAAIIQKKLKAKGLEGITVGTVHKLQGAERRIVLFSSVYTSTHSGGYFFDKKVNMLNVAVSRAQDSFIVFGDKNILDEKQNGKPSGLLARYVLN